MEPKITSGDVTEFLKDNLGECNSCRVRYLNMQNSIGDLKVAMRRYGQYPDSSKAKLSFEKGRDQVAFEKEESRRHMQYDH